MLSWFKRRYLDLLGSIYIYNEHRGYTAIDRLLAAADLPRLRSQYGREGAVSDAMAEAVTVRQAGQDPVRVATVSDPQDEPPAEFRALTDRLRELALTLPGR